MATLQQVMESLRESNEEILGSQIEANYNLEKITTDLDSQNNDQLEVGLEIMSGINRMTDVLSEMIITLKEALQKSLDLGFLALIKDNQKQERDRIKKENKDRLKDAEDEKEKKEPGAFMSGIKEGIEKGPFDKLKVLMLGARAAIVSFIATVGLFIGQIISLFLLPIKIIVGFIKFIPTLVKSIIFVGKLLFNVAKKLFLPITILIAAFSMVTGFMDAFNAQEGSFVDKVLAGFLGGIKKTVMNLIMIPADFLKKGAEWILDSLGFEDLASKLRTFSFAEWYDQAFDTVKDMIFGIKDWLVENLSWSSIKSKFTNIATEIGDSIMESVRELLRLIIDFFPKWLVPDKLKQFAGIDPETGEMTPEQQERIAEREVKKQEQDLEEQEKKLDKMLNPGVVAKLLGQEGLDFNDPEVIVQTQRVAEARNNLESIRDDSAGAVKSAEVRRTKKSIAEKERRVKFLRSETINNSNDSEISAIERQIEGEKEILNNMISNTSNNNIEAPSAESSVTDIEAPSAESSVTDIEALRGRRDQTNQLVTQTDLMNEVTSQNNNNAAPIIVSPTNNSSVSNNSTVIGAEMLEPNDRNDPYKHMLLMR